MKLQSILLVTTLLILLAGCTESGTAPDDHSLSGTFTEEADQDDFDDLQSRVEQRGTQVQFMETLPVEFEARPLSPSECDNLRLELGQVDYLQELEECRTIP